MTETEWLACGEPEPMLAFLSDRASGRKARLFALACCRVAPPAQAGDEESGLLDEVEACLEHTTDEACYQQAGRLLSRRTDSWTAHYYAAFYYLVTRSPYEAASSVSHYSCRFASPGPGPAGRDVERQRQSQFLRDIFGNPFRPVPFAPAWRTDTVAALAQGIYQERAFDRLPLLMDALMDAGCTNEDVLNHCRVEGVHVRGCWVIDLALGKE